MSFRSLYFLATLGTVVASGPAQGQSPELQQKINTAIEAGVRHLRQFDWNIKEPQGKTGQSVGAMALTGWTLLESGVDAKDKLIGVLADEVRARSASLTFNYSISLSIIFLEKLGDPGDFQLIESLAARLIAGQTRYGGWSYHSPDPGIAETRRVAAIVDVMKKKRDQGEDIPKQEKLSPEIVQLLAPLVVRAPEAMSLEEGDNSNTQFAMMALWVAKRHGLPVQRALSIVEQRFRHGQGQTGGWGYKYRSLEAPNAPKEMGPRMAMTCAGLLGIALGQGANGPKEGVKNLLKDERVKAALQALGTSLNNENPVLPAEEDGNRFYFLFSLERMAVVYDLKKIGDKDWYPLGAEYLVQTQQDNGAWKGKWSSMASDTCFALLFLKRANIASDLTGILQGIVKVPPKKDPVKPKIDDTKDYFKDLPVRKDLKKKPGAKSSRNLPENDSYRRAGNEPVVLTGSREHAVRSPANERTFRQARRDGFFNPSCPDGLETPSCRGEK